MGNVPNYSKDIISLIPYGLPQFLDFELSTELTKKIAGTFFEKLVEEKENEHGEFVQKFDLLEAEQNEDGDFVDSEDKRPVSNGDCCTVSSDKHIEPWLDRWIPIPFFREKDIRYDDGLPKYTYGPTNWARAFLTRKADEKNWRLVICFDMRILTKEDVAPTVNIRTLGLTEGDVSDCSVCSLAFQKRDNAKFLMEGWVNAWLEQLWKDFFNNPDKTIKKDRMKYIPKRMDFDPDVDSGEMKLGHFASYLIYLKLINTIIGKHKVRIAKVDEFTGEDSYINVDLILDIGNSRSTGILMEQTPGVASAASILDSYRLTLRDISRPYITYDEPFETHVEFVKTEFGLSEYSNRSGLANAFAWASPVRTGVEATRLACHSTNSQGVSGMSSPKRYLWDLDPRELWYFNKRHPDDAEKLVTSLPLCRFVNNGGIPRSILKEMKAIEAKFNEGQDKVKLGVIASAFQNIFGKDLKAQKDGIATNPRFARSSIMMFLFTELIYQAMLTINSFEQRDKHYFPDRPRRLRKVIFTVPPGMPIVEKTIYATWAKAAISVLWEVLGWRRNFYLDPPSKKMKELPPITDFRFNPSVKCEWDEATCTQLVYMYNEICTNYAGDATLFFEVMGKKRSLPKEGDAETTEIKPSLRVATVDVGGGTTDISVTTFVLANDVSSTTRIWPKQEISDGFNVGGDDVLRRIVTDVVLAGIGTALIKRKPSLIFPKIREQFRAMFGQRDQNIKVQNKRIQFVRQAAIPAAYALLTLYEKQDLHDVTETIGFNFRELFTGSKGNVPFSKADPPAEEIQKFFTDEMFRRFGVSLDIMDVDISVPVTEMDKAIMSGIESTLDSMGELVHAYNCDVLLLTGRPSCWNAVLRKFFAMLCIAPDRIIPMSNYNIGDWYRFAESGKIVDPKTTVVMGAELCELAENRIESFVFNSSRLMLKDPARFIGELDIQDHLSHEKVWFDLSHIEPGKDVFYKTVQFSAPISIGLRQLSVDRWSATKCWYMDFADEASRVNSVGRTPYEVRVEFKIPEPDEDDALSGKKLFREKINQPNINYVENPDSVKERDGETVVTGRPVQIKLCTLSTSDGMGCWMDTGILYSNN